MSEDDQRSVFPKPPRGFPSWGYYLLRLTLGLMFCRLALIAGSLVKAVDSYRRGAIVEGTLYLGLLLAGGGLASSVLEIQGLAPTEGI